LVPLVLLTLFFCFGVWGIWKYSAYHSKKIAEDTYNQGLKNLTDGNFDEAAKSLEKSIKNGNEATDALLKLGVSKYNQKDYDGAIEAYLKVLEKDPLNTTAGNSLGNVYRDKKDFEKAQAQYEKTIQLDSSFAPAYANLSIMLLDLDRKKEALDIVQKGLEKIPNSIELKNIITLLKPEE
jgi:tetratricopeptide (TPR) repeat protein